MKIWLGRTWFLSAPWRFSEKRRFKPSSIAARKGSENRRRRAAVYMEPEAFEQVDHLVLDEAE
jgi:hypothetical protein